MNIPTAGILPKLLAILTLLAAIGAAAWLLPPAGGPPTAAAQQQSNDYDLDDNGLIDIRNLDQLNAIRHDLDGDGDATHADYAAAFPGRLTATTSRMGCPAGACTGYELTRNLTFPAETSSPYNPWSPIGGDFTATFNGNGYTLTNLRINDSSNNVGLFRNLGGNGHIYDIGLINPNVTTTPNLGYDIGPLVGRIRAGSRVDTSYVLGGNVDSDSQATNVGGLVGANWDGEIRASYSTARVNMSESTNQVNGSFGGLLGWSRGGTTTASYAAGPVTGSGTVTAYGGLVGYASNSASIIASYCDAGVSTRANCVGNAHGSVVTNEATATTTAALQDPTDYEGIYANWNIHLFDDPRSDYPWKFGTSSEYPSLNTPAQRNALLPDYDRDDDGLIEVANLDQLDAIREDVNSDGHIDGNGDATSTAYLAAFPNRPTSTGNLMGCPNGQCRGYELTADLTFSATATAWTPLANVIGRSFVADFDGNGHTISDLRVNVSAGYAGLFGRLSGGKIGNIGLINPNVTSTYAASGVMPLAGALVGEVVEDGLVYASYVQGGRVIVTGNDARAGGLVGRLGHGAVRASYATAAVNISGSPTDVRLGGLTGYQGSDTGPGHISASYAAANVPSGSGYGGLVGNSHRRDSTIVNSYCDLSGGSSTACVSRRSGGSTLSPPSHTTAELQTPTGYTGIYANWNIDSDSDLILDVPWHFGTASQYPRLRWEVDPPAPGAPVDYDANNNNLIDVANRHQLYAMLTDYDGDGAPDAPRNAAAAAYNLGYPDRVTATSGRMGCPATCAGYELTGDLDLTAAAAFPPVPGLFNAVFDGQGHTITGLKLLGSVDVGLFGQLGALGVVRDVGLINPTVTARNPSRIPVAAGVLAGWNHGRIQSSYVQGGSVTYESSAVGPANSVTAGGLVGRNSGDIIASYAAAIAVSNTGTLPLAANIGGLAGENQSGGIVASYAAPGAMAGTGTVALLTRVGGLVGNQTTGDVRRIVNSYCDTATTTDCVAGVPLTTWPAYIDPGQTSAALQSPEGYTGIYKNWNLDLDGDLNLDYPWNFGATTSYPTLNTPSQRAAAVPPRRDYDRNNNNLIDVSSIAQLDAMRYDPDGDGHPQAVNAAAYGTIFAGREAGQDGRMGCPRRCLGYELTQDLAFDTSTPANWTPIPQYNAMLEGNGHTITGANIQVTAGNAGLIANLAAGAAVPTSTVADLGLVDPTVKIRNLGLIDFTVSANVRNANNGILAGEAGRWAVITGVYANGGSLAVNGVAARGGGLVGLLKGTIRASYANVAVTGGATSHHLGGLAGMRDAGTIRASYAVGAVSGSNSSVGGLLGQSASTTGRVVDSYCNHDVLAQSVQCIGLATHGATSTAYSTVELQTPTAYTGIYEHWNLDLDGDGNPDNPWNFGTETDYPQPGATLLVTDSPPPGGPRQAQPPQDTPYNPALDHPEIYQNDRHEMAATCAVQYNADGAPESSTITFNLGTYQGQVILHLAQWNGEYFTSYESLGIDMPAFQRDGQTATVRVTTNPANTRFLLDSVSPTTNLVLGYADCHTDDAAPADPAESDTTTSTAETPATETPATPPAPKVYVNEGYEMTASCAVSHDAEGQPESATITFNLGRYTGAVILSISLWNGEYYASLDSHGLDAPLLERNGQAATVQVTTNPAETRFLLDGTPNGLRTNLLLGYADCHTAGE